MRRLILPTLLAATIATASGAQTPLKDVTEISEGLIAAGMAIEIADNCDNISVRLIRGYSYLNGLKSRARELGYSGDEIDAYVDDKVEKARLEDIARQRLAEFGTRLEPCEYAARQRLFKPAARRAVADDEHLVRHLTLAQLDDGLGKDVEALFHHQPAEEDDRHIVIGKPMRAPPFEIALRRIEHSSVDSA